MQGPETPTPRPWGAKGAWTAALIVMAISLLATFTLSSPTATSPASTGPSGDATVAAGDTSEGENNVVATETDAAGAPDTASGPAAPGGKTYNCSKGQNAGASDVGVTAREIRFAATVVKSGIAKDFLSDAQFGMEAIRQKVNRAGGICGRILKIDYVDDGWDPDAGGRFIQKFIGEKKYFGLAVNPSSEGLRNAIDGGAIRNAGFPVVGADGMLIGQYKDPWVWPVATSTSSIMHVMAQDAFQRGARTFGIVWESNYRFGVEGHDAFVGSVTRLGGTVVSDVGIQGGQNSYKNQADEYIGKCGGVGSLNKCDFLAILLEPNTASQWVRDGGLGNGTVRPKIGIGGPQPLFLDSFARDCGKFCANMRVWTSFKPPIPPFDTDPAVVAYKNDLAQVSATADRNNPHVEGAYVGMLLLVDALKKLGPSPTRAGLRQVLDSMTLDTGLAPPLVFRPGNHFSNVSGQSFEAIVNNGSFANWRYTNSGFIADKEVGKDIP